MIHIFHLFSDLSVLISLIFCLLYYWTGLTEPLVMVCRYDTFSSFISRCNLSAVAKIMKLCWCMRQYKVKRYGIRWQTDWEKGSALKWVAMVSRWMELSKKKWHIKEKCMHPIGTYPIAHAHKHTQIILNVKSHTQLHKNTCRNRNPIL